MKKQTITASLILISLFGYGQWNGTNPLWTNSNVGIGTASPGYALDILTSQVNGGIRITQSTNNMGSSALSLRNITTGGREYIIGSTGTGNAQGAGHFSIYDMNGPANRFIIQGGTGFVGIGPNYNSPINMLDVFAGNINVQTLTNSYKINDRNFLWHKGDVTSVIGGIDAGMNQAFNLQSENTFYGYQAGFTSPGNTPLSPSTSNVLIGYQAGFNTKSIGNSFIGWRAGYSHNNSNTGLITCVGYECGFANQDGDNAFYGARAARNHVWGIENTVIGQVAGENMNLCSSVTFVGLGAGRNNGAFDRNNYFGCRAGSVSLGTDNIFIGTNAGLSGIGSKNVIMGNNAMQTAATGTDNVVIGYNANSVSPGTSFNTIIGSEAALVNNTGANNTYVGFQSAVAQTTGTNNAYLGFRAGNNMLTGSNNTFIGARADATNASSNLTNAAAIGGGALVTNNNHMILGNNNVNVGIGLSADATGPQNKLEINTGVANTSGLRFRQLTSGSTPGPNPGPGVLAVDPNGDVIYVNQPASSGLGNPCNLPAAGTNPLTSNWEIPLNSNNFIFSGNNNGSAVNNVGIGMTANCTPQAKLHVEQSSGSTNGSIGILVENTDQNTCGANPVIGLKSMVTNTSLNDLKIAGWFESTNAPNCFGSTQNYAIVVPQNGGMVQVGYNPVNFSNLGTWLLDVNGITNSVLGYSSSSDKTLKNSIETISPAVSKIMEIRPVTYKWNDTRGNKAAEGIHAGFIAQELEKVIPHTVYTADDGKRSVFYNEIIPYLVSGIQEQQAQIEKQQKQIDELKEMVKSLANAGTPKDDKARAVNLSDKNVLVLNQNVPNPFAESTVITYNIPTDFTKAQLIFTTSEGKVINTIEVTTKGEGRLNVFANDLSSGMYSYTLVVDGKTIDTKKMVKQ